MRNLSTHPSRVQGFTLLETTIAMVILGLVVGSVAMLSASSERSFRTSWIRTQLEAQSVSAVNQLVDELRIAVGESMDPVFGEGDSASSVQFVQALAFDGTEVEFSSVRVIEFEYAAGEVDDGVDNNGNGLVDEGHVVLVEDVGTADERRRVITRWVREFLEGEEDNGLDDNGNGLVDEPGFVLVGSGRTLTLHLTLERLDGDGRPIQRTARSAAKLRN